MPKASGQVGGLSQLRVLEIGGGIAASYCTKLMAGFGADVIKIEPSGSGDAMRRSGPFLGSLPGPERSIPFHWYNTGKRSMMLDLEDSAEREQLRNLVRHADLVVEGLAPGALAALGLDLTALHGLRPGIVVTSISPFGQSGPYRDYQAEEITLYAMSGLMYATGDPAHAPLAAAPAICQLSAGMKAYIASLMAIYRRGAGRESEWIDISIHECALDNIEIAVAEFLHLGKTAKRTNDEHPLVPWRIFPCSDGYAAIIGGPIRHWLDAARLFEVPALTAPDYAHMEDRIRHRDEIRRLMQPWLSRHGKQEIFHLGQQRKMAWGYLATLDDVVGSPQYAARGYLAKTKLPDHGTAIMPGAPFRPERTPWQQMPAPQFGAHKTEILSELSRRDPEGSGAAPGEGAKRGSVPQPLEGVRIVDLTHDWAGPHAVRILADYGAEVIKVEYPARLDGMRGAYLDRLDKHPRWWQINRNKKSITLDFHRRDHVAACLELVRASDLVVENSRPGVLDGFGLGYESLCEARPDIILASLSAHGATGPYGQYAGYGGAIEALSGVQSLTAYGPDSDPMRIREVDVTNGIMGACAIMTALIHRLETGEGQRIDLSETETCTWLIGEQLLEFTANGHDIEPRGNRHREYVPQGCYPCRGEDRWLVITIRSDTEWRVLCDIISRPDRAEDERFSTAAGRRRHYDEIDAMIGVWTRQQDAREAVSLLQARGIAAGFVADTRDIVEDPHLAARGWVSRPETGEQGDYPGFPFRFRSSGAGRYWRRGPDLGADNQAILRDLLGLPEDVIPPLDPDHLGTAFDVD